MQSDATTLATATECIESKAKQVGTHGHNPAAMMKELSQISPMKRRFEWKHGAACRAGGSIGRCHFELRPSELECRKKLAEAMSLSRHIKQALPHDIKVRPQRSAHVCTGSEVLPGRDDVGLLPLGRSSNKSSFSRLKHVVCYLHSPLQMTSSLSRGIDGDVV